MQDPSKTISDDFSDACDGASTETPKVPDGASKLPGEIPASVYARTSDKKPLNPDPLQRREKDDAAVRPERDFGERLLDG